MAGTPHITARAKSFHFVSSVLETFLTVGIVYGWTPLLTILLAEGQYDELCNGGGCTEQTLKLNLIYTVSVSVGGVMFLPAGYFLDRYGARISRLVGSALFTVGLILFAVSNSKKFDAFVPGYLLIGMGGPSIFCSFFHWSSMFAKSELYLTMLNCALDAGPIIFFIFQLLYSAGAARMPLFIGYITFGVMIFIHSALMKDPVDLGKGGKRKQRHAQIFVKDISKTGKGVPRIQEDFYSLKEQLKSIYYILASVCMVVVSIRINFYVGTVSEQLKAFNLSQSQTEMFQILFNVVFPLGSIAWVMPISWLLRRYSIITSLFVGLTVGIVFGILTMTSNVYLQAFCFVLLSLFRPLIYSILSTYVTVVFGFPRFGTLYGIMGVINGIFSFGQYFLTWLVYNSFDGSFFEVNLGLTFLTCLMFIFPAFLKLKKRINDTTSGNSYLLLQDKIEKETRRSSGRNSKFDSVNNSGVSFEDSSVIAEEGTYVPPIPLIPLTKEGDMGETQNTGDNNNGNNDDGNNGGNNGGTSELL